MRHTMKPDRLANGRASGLQVSVQETHRTNTSPSAFISSFDLIAVHAPRIMSARFGLSIAATATISDLSGMKFTAGGRFPDVGEKAPPRSKKGVPVRVWGAGRV
jgi:hypothetical protein